MRLWDWVSMQLLLYLFIYCISVICLVEWCLNSDFKPAIGEFMMTDLRNMEYVIPDLDKVSHTPRTKDHTPTHPQRQKRGLQYHQLSDVYFLVL